MQSVTYIPNFNKIDEDYLIIDFPGFKDTKGKYSQLSIQLMFDEIVTKTNVKIAVVFQQTNTILVERGIHLQKFIQSAFTSQKTKFDSIGLIINQFQQPINENAIEEIRKQIIEKSLEDKTNENVYQALSKQIIIMEDVYDKNIDEVLSENARQSLISRLKQIPPISYQPDYQDENQVVSSYIKQELENIFKKYNETLQKQKADAKSNKYQLQNFITTLKDLIKQLNEISQNDCDPQTQFIKDFLSKIEQSKDKKQSQEKFFCIYQYFFKYKESISGYQYFKDKKKQLKKIIKLFIDELQEELKRQEDIEKQEKQKLDEIKATQEKAAQEKQFQLDKKQQAFDHQQEMEKLKLQKPEEKTDKGKPDPQNQDQEQLEQLQKELNKQKLQNDENEKQINAKEHVKQQLRQHINQTNNEITKLNAKKKQYQEGQIQLWWWNRDGKKTQIKTEDEIDNEILNYQLINQQAKDALIYDDKQPEMILKAVKKALEDAKTLKEGAEKPKEGAEKPKEGAEKPKEGAEKPKEGAEKPKEGAEKPKEGAEKPKEGANKATEQIQTKKDCN